ncbi:MAG TPA: hypothetical protein VMX57_00200 [Planctomycetota bacterium]|nr:hypothetical protein [Planctomycetota bacterium]
MALITTYATLQSEVALWLNRTDLTDNIKVFIQLAEKRLNLDYRVKDPDGATTAVTALSDANTTNWLLTLAPDIYLYATLVEAGPYLVEDTRVPAWEAALQQRLEQLSGNVRVDPARTGITNTTHATLIRAVMDFLNRGDLEAVIPLLIINAERTLNRDPRVRTLSTATFSITADDLAVPTGFRELVSWYHDSTSYKGQIEIVGADQLGYLKSVHGSTGVPWKAAIVDAKFRFAPAPDATYSTKMTFWLGLTALSAGSNWLIASHSDIYLYAVLREAIAYDNRIAADPRASHWVGELERRLEEMHQYDWAYHAGGTMVRNFTPIGG